MVTLSHGTNWVVWVPALVNLLKALGIIPGTMAAFWLRHWYQKRRQRKAMEGWSSTEARFHSAAMRQEGSKQWLEITYSYFADEYRSGTYVRRINKKDDAAGLIRQLRDKRFQVRYDPADPDKSVILDRDLEMVTLLAPQVG